MKKILLSIGLAGLLFSGAAAASININTASADQLSTLDGIGQVKAEAIVKDREANGNYNNLQDLTRVSGIGNKTVESIRDEAGTGAEGGSASNAS